MADNLDLGCGVIEKTAMDKAVREIDHHLMAGYEVHPTPGLLHLPASTSYHTRARHVLSDIISSHLLADGDDP